MKLRMEIQERTVATSFIGWEQIGTNHYTLAGFIDGLFEMSDIDGASLWFGDLKARQVVCSSLRKQFKVGDKVRVFFTAEAIT